MVGKKTTIALAILAVLGLVATFSSYAYAFREMEGLRIQLVTEEKQEKAELLKSIVNPPETPESTEKSQKSQESTYSEPKTVTKPQPVQQAPVQQKAQVEEPVYHQAQPERIPFTQKPVVPGDPASYIGTYGQCPFYENAGEKGCYPPVDIECNADWSVCTPKGKSDEAN